MASAQHLEASQIATPHPGSARAIAIASIPPCPLCGAADTTSAFTDAGCALRVCASCELFFVHPYPTRERQHEQVASGMYERIELLDCRRRYEGERLYYSRHFTLIAEEVRGAASLLDVGCGTGHLLERFREWPGLHRVGIELNSRAAEFARRAAACAIVELPFEEFSSELRFDAITLINVLSHIPSLDALFRSLRAALAPGGKVILRSSEISRRVSRWNQVHWGIPDDLHFLGLNTMEFLCRRHGFAIVRHIRTPFEDELFEASRWRQMGRSRLLNFVKQAAVRIPGVLPALRTLYTHALGQRLFVSFIVLKPLPLRKEN